MNLDPVEAEKEPNRYVLVLIDEVPVVFELMIPTIEFERFLLSSREVKRYVERRIRELERKYIPSLEEESFGIREILSNNTVLQIFIEEIVPKRLGIEKKSVTLKEKVKAFFNNIRRTNIPLDQQIDVKDKFSNIIKEIDKINRFRQEYIIAKTEIENRRGTGFLASIFNELKLHSILFVRQNFYKLDLIKSKNGLRVYMPRSKLAPYDEFFSKWYAPLLNNYVNALAIKYVWETRENFIHRMLKNVPDELIRLVIGASKTSNWFIEIADIGLERRGDMHYLYQWTGEFALIEILNENNKGNLYLFPSFKVAVPFKISGKKLQIYPAVVLDPPTLHPFLPASSGRELSICFGRTAQAYSNVTRRGTVTALLTALEMAVEMIKGGYGHGAGPYRTLEECGVKKVDYNYLVKRKIPVTNLSDKDARELLRKKWGAKI